MRETHPADSGSDQDLWKDSHLTDGAIRAHLDGELSTFARLRAALHLRRCRRCTAALVEQRSLARDTSALLASALPRVDVEEGWHRFLALSAGVARRRSSWWKLGAAALAASALAVAILLAPRSRGSSELAPHARDACCWDLDGGGHGDDGIFTLSRSGEVVECVVLYDDVDRTGALSASDLIRYVSDPAACGLSPAAAIPRRADELFRGALALSAGS